VHTASPLLGTVSFSFPGTVIPHADVHERRRPAEDPNREEEVPESPDLEHIALITSASQVMPFSRSMWKCEISEFPLVIPGPSTSKLFSSPTRRSFSEPTRSLLIASQEPPYYSAPPSMTVGTVRLNIHIKITRLRTNQRQRKIILKADLETSARTPFPCPERKCGSLERNPSVTRPYTSGTQISLLLTQIQGEACLLAPTSSPKMNTP